MDPRRAVFCSLVCLLVLSISSGTYVSCKKSKPMVTISNMHTDISEQLSSFSNKQQLIGASCGASFCSDTNNWSNHYLIYGTGMIGSTPFIKYRINDGSANDTTFHIQYACIGTQVALKWKKIRKEQSSNYHRDEIDCGDDKYVLLFAYDPTGGRFKDSYFNNFGTSSCWKTPICSTYSVTGGYVYLLSGDTYATRIFVNASNSSSRVDYTCKSVKANEFFVRKSLSLSAINTQKSHANVGEISSDCDLSYKLVDITVVSL